MYRDTLWKKNLKKIQSLKHGQHVTISNRPNDDCGDAEIWFINEIYLVFEIPEFGGNPVFQFTGTHCEMILKTIESWA